MNGFLLDTNVVSEPRRPRPDPGVQNFFYTTPQDQMFISVVSVAEMRYGIQLLNDAQRRNEMDEWLFTIVRPMFAGRVLDVTENIMLRWRIVLDEGRKRGRTFTQPDLLIAATALEYGLTIVTRNVKDFTGLSLNILNPWDQQP